jgi:nucleotide-binding universal stress UspA family protein
MGATMKRILACVDDSPLAPDVLATARSLARRNDATVDALTVTGPRPLSPTPASPPGPTRSLEGDPIQTLLRELGAPDVEMAVIGARSIHSKPAALGHVARAIISTSSVPLVVVPPGARPLPADEPVTMLLPLDGHVVSDSIVPLAHRLVRDVDRVIVLHVFDSDNVPMFVASGQEQATFARDFLAKHAGKLPVESEMRIGRVSAEILDVARQAQVDVILLCWDQDLGVGRADVVQRLIAESPVPVILHPTSRSRRATPGSTATDQ